MWQLLSIETNIYPQLPASCLRYRLLLLITALALLLQCKGRFSAALPVPNATSVLALLFLAPPVQASPSFWKASSACVRSSYTPPAAASPTATSPSIADSPPAAARTASSPAGTACAAVARATAAAAAPAAVSVRAVGLRVSSACGEVVFGEAGGSAAVAALSDAQGLRLFDRVRVGLFRNRSGWATSIDSSTAPDDISRGILLSSSSSISGGRRTASKRSKGSNSCSRYCSSSKRSFTRCSSCLTRDPSLVQIVQIASAAVPCDAQITPKPSSLRASALEAADAWKAAAGFAAAVTQNKRAKRCRCCCLLKNIDGTAGVLLTHEGRQLRDGAAAGKGSHHLHRQASWQLTRKEAQAPRAASQAESPAAATAAAKPLPIAAQVVATVPPTAQPIAVTPLTAAGTANVSSPPAAALSAATQTTASCLPPAAATSSAAADAVPATRPSATAAQSGLARLPQKWFTRTTDQSSLVRPSLRRSSSSLTSLPLLLLQLPLRVARVRLTLTPTAAARPSAEAADEVDAAEAAAKTPRAVAQSLRLLLSRSLLLRVPVLLSTGALLLVLLLQIRYACSARSGKTCTSRRISSTTSSKCNGASSACAAVRAIAAVTLAEEVLCTLQGQIEQLKYEARTLSIPSEYHPLSSSNGSRTEKANSSGNSNTYRGSSSSNGDDSSRSADSSIWNYDCSGDLCRHPCRTGEFQSSSQGKRMARAYCSNYCPPERQLPRAATWAVTQWENENGDNERKNEYLSFYASAAAAYVDRFLELWHQAQHLLQGGLPQRQQQKRQLQQKQKRNLQVGALESQQQEGQDRREGIRRSGKSINREKGKQQPQRHSEKRQQRQPQRHLAQKEDSRPWELAETQSRAAGDGVEFVEVDGVRCCCSRWCSTMEESNNFYKDSLSCTSSLSRRNSSSSDSINGGTSNNSNGRSDSEHAKLRWSAVAERRGRVTAAVYCPVAALARQQLQEKFYSLAADIYRCVLQRLHQELLHKFSKEFACLVGGMPAFDREACRLRCTYTTLHREACAAAALPVKPVIGHRLLQSCSRHVATATTRNTDHPCSDRWCSSSRCWWRSRNGWRFWWNCCSSSSTIRNSSNGICMECVNQEFSEALQRLIEERSMEGVALKEAAAAVESLQAWKVVQHVAQVTAARLLPLVLQFFVGQLQQKYTAGALSAGRRSLVRRRTPAQ